MQYGNGLTDSNGGINITFPISFSNTNYTILPTLGYLANPNGLKIQWLKYQDGFAVNTVKDNLYLPLPFTSPSTCEIIGYYDNSSGTMSLSAVGARLYGNNTNRFKAITNGGQYSFFAIGY